MESDDADGAPREGVATYVVEAVVACLIIIFGVTVAQGSWKLGAGWMGDGPGAGYFPFYIGVILCIAGAGVLAQTVISKRRSSEVFVDRVQLRRVLSVLIPAAIYVGAVQLIGLYIASAIYIAVFMVVLGEYSIVKSILTAVIINVVFFAMFEIWFKVPLFKGAWNLLSFTGY